MAPLALQCEGLGFELGPQEVSNIVWALALEQLLPVRLQRELATAALRHRSEFKRKELVNTIWAFAASGERAWRLESVDSHHLLAIFGGETSFGHGLSGDLTCFAGR